MRLPGRLIGEVGNWRPRGSWRATGTETKKETEREREKKGATSSGEKPGERFSARAEC